MAAIGRFELIRTLGKGAQGTVWLARDPVLGRQVALKVWHDKNVAQQADLLDEARAVSRLQHPHIVQLYDVLTQDGAPVLVFEYVDGVSLADHLRFSGRLEPYRAARILRDVLSGLTVAHAQGLLHRDIKPANVILDLNDQARLMDFGVAAPVGVSGDTVSGSPQYMPPEAVHGSTLGLAADVFSVGVLGYEMMTGHSPFAGDNLFAVFHRIAHVPITPPSQLQPEIPPALEHVLLVALNKEAGERYAQASDMLAALEAFLAPPLQAEGSSTGQTTLDFLLRRLQHAQDFPALSRSISAINKLVAADAESIHRLAETILRDFSLTNKLLRMVNSATYGQFGGTISTISRAVMILGFEAVRNLAIGLVLFEHLQNRSQASHLRELMLSTFLSGLLAKGVARKLNLRSTEESFIGGMFYQIGKLLTAYYLHDEYQEIERRQQQGSNEAAAVVQVLGLSYAELGVGIAREWNFPDRLVQALHGYTSERVPTPHADTDRLRLSANLAGELTQLATSSAVAERDKLMVQLAERYGAASGMRAREQLQLLQAALADLARDAHYFGLDAGGGDFLQRMQDWTGLSGAIMPSAAGNPGELLEEAHQQARQAAVSDMTTERPDAQAILSAGIQDITNSLVSDFKLNDLINMILETMYRGMGFQRVLFCARDARSPRLQARFGYGADLARMQQQFVLPLDGAQDVFQLALAKNLDVQIDDASAPNIAERVPAWFRRIVGAEAFLILPLQVDKRLVGMFYADQALANTLQLGSKELTLLKTLRNQAVLAIRQKQA
ncbi:serine/threonine protein kinase [Leeia aquatica]|uniref:HDOD domain-containing protein n=1 Tax=Leeia aquatica TaxID=2725557 RepID=A0A847RUR1_9NEIS|nr:serine/threonine protein kinase [Leeia aquatica]NLR74940.1 HDOD domain-containing protein [Leeia aquatica]